MCSIFLWETFVSHPLFNVQMSCVNSADGLFSCSIFRIMSEDNIQGVTSPQLKLTPPVPYCISSCSLAASDC